LQELVYKQGQAGVTKASVSIVFNNDDRSRSPVGYEHCDRITVTRQIVIGGRNKYLINGQTAQPTRVQNLFHSVQLNVNNPHFLIMQGRITKVLNMKPHEILSMLEEAAGTRMYESKKEAALKTLDKKQTKVDEIDKLLEEEILPTIDKLRKERGEYMKWAAGNDALERLRRFCVAHEFVTLNDELRGRALTTKKLRDESDALDARAADRDVETNALLREQQALETEQSNNDQNGETARLAEEVSSMTKSLVKERASLTHAASAVDAERATAARLREQQSQHESEAAKEEERLKALEASHVLVTDAEKAAVAAFEKAELTLRGVQSGTGAGGDGNKSLQTQLAESRSSVAELEAKGKNASMRKKHCEKELVSLKKKLEATEKKGSKLAEALRCAEASFEAAKKAHEAHPGFAAASDLSTLESEAETAETVVREMQEKVDVLNGQLAGLDFKFADPEAKFDRRRVKGVVAKLMRVSDPATATALEVVAGGKLFQVVVDTEVTGKALLAKGKLAKRVTIVPLNKIDGRGATDTQLSAAKDVSGGDAKLALSLVTYDDDVKNVMSYVFGKAFVCKDAATARAVAFHKDVLANCVTVEGDLLNPSGLLTGGSRKGGASVLAKLHALHQAEVELETAVEKHANAKKMYESAFALTKEAQKLEADVDQAEHAFSLAKEKLAGSEAAALQASVTETESALALATTEAAEAAEASIAAKSKCDALNAEIEAFANEREARLERARVAVTEAKAALATARQNVKAAETEMSEAAVARGSAAAERASIEETIAAADECVTKLEHELLVSKAAVTEHQAQLDALTSALNAKRSEAAALAKRFAETKKKLASIAKRADADAVARKQMEHKMSRAAKDASDSETRLARLHEDHPWIETESHLFGVANGEYDFATRDPIAATAELADAEATQQNLAKKINKKVIAMFDKAESEFKALQEKRRIVLNDRAKIEAVISELDEKKKEALKVTWTKVNADFGSIFSTLLTSASAKLEPPEGESFLAGLEVRVAFGGVWKESLTELSGGQRSLLALSLILALLLFKPAPIYILDEVDAALDLSHTQNIGRMIRAHFPYSQFIVVSLKEGMFNNANCIFRTKFVDGVSTVTRTVPALKSSNQNNADDLKGAAGVSDGAAAKARRRAAAEASKENAEEN
jgi:structural maintenance of chromosome 2